MCSHSSLRPVSLADWFEVVFQAADKLGEDTPSKRAERLAAKRASPEAVESRDEQHRAKQATYVASLAADDEKNGAHRVTRRTSAAGRSRVTAA